MIADLPFGSYQASAQQCLLEMAPGAVAAEITAAVSIPTLGVGAGNGCDAQVLVWQDMAGLCSGRSPRFVKQYADRRTQLRSAARDFMLDAEGGTFPGSEHVF